MSVGSDCAFFFFLLTRHMAENPLLKTTSHECNPARALFLVLFMQTSAWIRKAERTQLPGISTLAVKYPLYRCLVLLRRTANDRPR